MKPRRFVEDVDLVHHAAPPNCDFQVGQLTLIARSPYCRSFDEPTLHQMVHAVSDLARRECHARRVAVSGASLGAYHAANIAFRHPDSVGYLISLSGSFDISDFFNGYHDDNIYFNSPYEYLPNTTDPWKYNHMGIIIGTGEWDNTRHESYRLSEILNSKGIQHWLDDGKWRGHDWNYWRDMLPYY